jgi:serine protease Do
MSRALLIFITLGTLQVFSLPTVAENQPQGIQDQIFRARDRVLPGLVHIQPVIKDYFTGELKKQAVIGSGVIFHPEGYVVTNYHVAGKAERIICTLDDKVQVPADYVGGDPPTDIAVIKLRLDDYAGTINVAQFGNSDMVEVGQFVLAMGSPLSLSRSVSAGVISTKDRYFSSDVRLPTGEPTGRYNLWIQTDAAINPGNSGGPLVNLDGLVIGINSRATMFANNLGFAIPINVAKEVTNAILTYGKVSRSWIGVHAQALQELENHFGTANRTGVLISSVDPGSPAEKSFLKAGDVVLEVNGESVSARFLEELPVFYSKIARTTPGEELKLKVLRNEEEYSFNVVTLPLGALQGEDFEVRDWGFTVKGITRHMQMENQLRDSLGVYVVGVKRVGTAEEGGLRPGDVITEMNRNKIVGLADFMTLYTQFGEGNVKKILLTVSRGNATRLAVLKIESEEKKDSSHEQ